MLITIGFSLYGSPLSIQPELNWSRAPKVYLVFADIVKGLVEIDTLVV